MSSQSKDQIRFSTVGISNQSVSRYDGNVKTLSIPLDMIRNVSLEYGNPVERPMTQILIAFILVGLGLILGFWPLYSMISKGNLPETGTVLMPFCYAVPLMVIGGWFFVRCFQKKYFLYVETEGDKRKLVFESVNEQEVRFFVDRANKRYGLNIRNVWPEKRFFQS